MLNQKSQIVVIVIQFSNELIYLLALVFAQYHQKCLTAMVALLAKSSLHPLDRLSDTKKSLYLPMDVNLEDIVPRDTCNLAGIYIHSSATKFFMYLTSSLYKNSR